MFTYKQIIAEAEKYCEGRRIHTDYVAEIIRKRGLIYKILNAQTEESSIELCPEWAEAAIEKALEALGELQIKKPLVSIIVPAYNQGQYLSACLDSIWFQDYPKLEIIIINDASTDDTSEVIAEFRRAVKEDCVSFASFYNSITDTIERTYHPRYPQQGRELRIINHKYNRGLAPTLNTGFSSASGRYCTYVPSDDMLLPSMISEMVTELDSGIDFVYADMAIVDDRGHWVRLFSLPEYSFERCFRDWYLCGVAKLYRTELHQKSGWYDESLLAHDHELFLRFAEHGAKFRHIPKVLMYVREHDKREVDIHSPSNWNRLLEESKKLTTRARQQKIDDE